MVSPKIAIMAGSYFPTENWFYKNNRIHIPVWLDHIKKQTPNSENIRFMISDGNSHPKIKEEINKLNGGNNEVYLDGPKGEFYNFKHLCSKLKDEEYVIYLSNDMIIRNIDNEDWIGKCIEYLNKYNPFAVSIWSGGRMGTGNWDYESLVEPNLYKMRYFSTQFILMKRETVNNINWDYVHNNIANTDLCHWESWLNQYYIKEVDIFRDNMYLTYTHDKLGCITLGEYSDQKVNNYINSTTFFSHDY